MSVSRASNGGCNATLALREGHIDVWLAHYRRIEDEHLLARYRALLSEPEQAQEGRFRFADDQRRYLITRALLRTVLSRYLAVAPAEWRFETNRYGRPGIANREVQSAGLRFNLSHTGGLIALAIARHREIGIDVENIRERQAPLEIADRYFAPEEAAALACLPAHRQEDRFFEYWTFKEAYIKARGLGLSIPLDKFSFRYPHETAVQISIEPELRDEARRWRFWQFRPAAAYLLAICAEHRSGNMPSLSINTAIPTVLEQQLRLEPLRVSP